MSVLYINTLNIGNVGFNPTQYMISTDNTLSEVSTPGYLNENLNTNNYAFNYADFAWVTTTDSGTMPFQISIEDGIISLDLLNISTVTLVGDPSDGLSVNQSPPGTWNISLSQNLSVTGSPTFTNLNLTGLSGFPNSTYALALANTSDGLLSTLTPSATTGLYLSNNNSGSPKWDTISATSLTGVLPIANGGTNSSTALANGLLMVSRSGKIIEIDAAVSAGGYKITNLANPTQPQDAVTKFYADQLLYNFSTKFDCTLATAAALPTNVYNNGLSGVGATLTGSSNGALSVDSTLVVLNQRILVKNEATTANNGIYVVTTVGDASNPYVLTRANDFDTPTEMVLGASTYITSGSTNSGYTFALNSTVVTVGTSAVTFAQIGGAAFINIGNFGSSPNSAGLSISGTTLTMQPASAGFPGGVSTGTQSFVGLKTFTTGLISSTDSNFLGNLYVGPGTVSNNSLLFQTNAMYFLTSTNRQLTIKAVPTSNWTFNYPATAPASTGSVMAYQGSSTPSSWIPTSSTSTASALVLRDANANAITNAFINGVTTLSPAGTTTYTLTASSTTIQVVTTSSTANFILPDATTLSPNISYTISQNSGSFPWIIQANDTSTLFSSLLTNYTYVVQCTNNSTTNGTWQIIGSYPSNGASAYNAVASFGSSPNASGISSSFRTLTLQPASASFPGGVSTTTQTFAGAKTFQNSLVVGVNGTSNGSIGFSGSTSGTVTMQVQAAAGTFNYNLPTSAGTAGYLLTSGGGGSNPMTWTSASSTPAGSSIVTTDSNGNFQVNNPNSALLTVVGAGGTTVLTASSARKLIVSGTSCTIQLPVVTTLYNGFTFEIISTQAVTNTVTITTSGGNTLASLSTSGTSGIFTVLDTTAGTGTASWTAVYSTGSSVGNTIPIRTATGIIFSTTFNASKFTSSSSNASTSGVLTLANTDQIGWRNSTNNANLLLYVDTNNNLNYTGGIMFTNYVVTVTNGVGSPYSISNALTQTCFNNNGASALVYLTLPASSVGLSYTFMVTNANGMRITAPGGSTLYVNGTASTSGGTATSTTIGTSVTFTCASSTQWIATAVGGTWTLA